jgi:diguanylate cyclase (GGDEF)-like protein
VLHLTAAETPCTVFIERGATIADSSALEGAMADLVSGLGTGPLPHCEQDAKLAALPAPFRFEDGVRSYYLMEIGRPRQGLLLLLHTAACPRGFTLLCQDLGARLAEAADSLLQTARARAHLQREIDHVSRDRKEAERRLLRSAHYDALTDLPNRTLLTDRLEHAIGQAQRTQRRVTLLTVELDRFKGLKDIFGADFGDRFIRAAAAAIQKPAAHCEMLARLGETEFGVLLSEIDSVEAAAAMAAALVERFTPTLRVDERDFYCSASVGIAVFPDDSSSVEELLRNADSARSLAREAGGNSLQFFTPAIHQRAVERIASALGFCARRSNAPAPGATAAFRAAGWPSTSPHASCFTRRSTTRSPRRCARRAFPLAISSSRLPKAHLRWTSRGRSTS